MKKILTIVSILFLSGAFAFAQMPPASKPDAELTRKEAELRIQDFQSRVSSLETKLNELNAKYEELEIELKNVNAALRDCNDEIKRILGATDADIEAFAQRLGVLEGKVRDMKRLNDDQLADRRSDVEALENEYLELRKNKISIMPKFFDRMVQLGRDIRGLYREKKITTYTVGTWAENRDCLWNISGKMEIYGDPLQWPKIWQANTDQIRNPDIIFPGQVLKIPPAGPKTPEEIKAERRYWRLKRQAAEQQQPSAVPGN
ncbi:MAG TPA: LysM peptidoglycan-binding domain-containing protein [Candidatus Kapabacteria bacterium]|nr:LysM peptidoglycan-binding domain-containing protein [Candidatus Kapabacteria bacterium]HOM04638.1 LysM peptidoglycan-binding domain-containing protein [Candidatus Kapabacteria bacterium]